MILDVIVEDKKKKLKEHKKRISEEKMKRWQSRDYPLSESLKRLLQVWVRLR